MNETILIVEDEPEMLLALRRLLTKNGYAVATARNGNEACEAMAEEDFDLVISDMAMEGMNGIELLSTVQGSDSTIPFIIITGVGTIESAVEAIRMGAFHYITKPFRNDDMEVLVQRAIAHGKLKRRKRMRQASNEAEAFPKMIVGGSKSMQDLMRRVDKISDSMAPVLITGETGTGKSLLAEGIHRKSARRRMPFLAIDCAALTETLLESELFGHVKGAFTGATHTKRGLLEEAQGGTIFLDEICEVSPSTQVKLLRAVQDGLIKPVGGNRTIKIDVRFISASNQNVHGRISEGLFREDLYYRLSVVPLEIPPLRERREDIPSLVEFFLDKFCRQYGRTIGSISTGVLEMLLEAPWKGNVRELGNVLERSVLLAENDVITQDCLLDFAKLNNLYCSKEPEKRSALPLRQVIEKAEKRAILQAVQTTGNNRSQCARILGISRRTLYDKIALYGLN